MRSSPPSGPAGGEPPRPHDLRSRDMSRSGVVVTSVAAALIAGFIIGESTKPVQGQAANAGFPAVAGYKGGLDVLSGPYEVVPNWPKPLSQLPGHENWTWGAVQGVFAESPDRVF